MIGQTLGHYEILEKIGEGGMGVVYKARDTHLDRSVAVKVLPAAKVGDPDRQRRFVQEAKAASALNHPSIVHIYDIAREGDDHYIAMEYVAGKTLDRLIERKGLGLNEAMSYSIQAADALARAHAAGIVHRDLKPSNIMVTEDGHVKILDFGLAKLTEVIDSDIPNAETVTQGVDDKPITDEGMVMGTAAYMSPEQAEGKKVDARSDIFSFGSVLYEMVSGRRAFQGSSMVSTLAAVIGQEPAPLSDDLPHDIRKIIGRCLKKDPARRFQHMHDLKVQLQELKEDSDSGRLGGAPFAAAAKARRAPWTFAIVAVALLLGAAAFYYWQRGRGEQPISSLAVLPFTSGEVADDEYLGDGIAESTIRSLSRLPGLKVRPFQSVVHFRGASQDAIAAGERLKVRAVLVGRVVRSGNDLAVSAELIDVRENTALWGERYRRPLTDLLNLQEQIGLEIAERLRPKLTAENKAGLARRSTQDAEAYRDYLRGRYFSNKRTGDVLRTAISYFDAAIERDPRFALAYAGLADCYMLLPYVTATPGSWAYPKAKAAALKALELDPEQAEAYPVLGVVQRDYEWKWSEAEVSFRKALALNPDYPTAHQWYGESLYLMGRFEEALAEMKRAQELDPLSLIISKQVGDVYLVWRRYDEAIAQYKATLQMDPHFAYAHEGLARAYLRRHMYSEAIEAAEKAAALDPKRPGLLAALAIAHTKAGHRAEADRAFAAIEERQKTGEFPAILMAWTQVETGDNESALLWLERAMDDRSIYLLHLKTLEQWDPLRSDPRFLALLRRMNFPD